MGKLASFRYNGQPEGERAGGERRTMQTLVLYLDGFLNEQETIARLLPQKLKDQATFKTEKALACLRCTEVITP